LYRAYVIGQPVKVVLAGQPRQDIRGWSAETGQPGQVSLDRTYWMVSRTEGPWDMTIVAGQESRDATTLTGQPVQDIRDRSAETGKPVQVVLTGQPGLVSWDW
jgi:hypothetical protein